MNKTLEMVAEWLLVIGGLNWGLVAFNYNLVESLLGFSPMLVQIVYLLVGLSALYAGYTMVSKKGM